VIYHCLAIASRDIARQTFLRADQVIVVVHALVELDPVDLAVELAGAGGVVFGHRRAIVAADVQGLIDTEYHRLCIFDAPFSHLVTVQVECDPTASVPARRRHRRTPYAPGVSLPVAMSRFGVVPL
jgi:hypothetical protein